MEKKECEYMERCKFEIQRLNMKEILRKLIGEERVPI